MLRMTEFAQMMVRSRLKPGAVVVDATVGNGHDTVMLAEAVGPLGQVFGFDIQVEALASARSLVGVRTNLTLFHAGHERIAELLPTAVHGHLAAVLFNLGYLPGGDREQRTRRETTISALQQALALISVDGLVTLVLYPGHSGGADEAGVVLETVKALPATFAVHHTVRLNAATPAPQLVLVERLK